jgi:hypothetical protein
LDLEDGEVEEPHGAQSVVQGAQERHQEAQAPTPSLYQGGKPNLLSSCCISDPGTYIFAQACGLDELCSSEETICP